MTDIQTISTILNEFEQQHILQFWDTLSEVERNELIQDLKEVNIAEVMSFFKIAVSSLNADNAILDEQIKPISPEHYGAVIQSSASEIDSYYNEGLKQISEGKVCVILMAGGQGTRLGVTYPKGMYDVGLISHKTLYQIQAERILKLNDLAYKRTSKRGNIIWYIMTSEDTMKSTKDFLEKHNFFGLKKEHVILFKQGLFPCFTFDGKIILDKKSKIAKAPDGNGGLYRALKVNKILEDFNRRGIEFIHVHGVDNILVKVADPIFIGYCIHKGAECGAKVVEKLLPNEAIGIVCQVNRRHRVVEYSEITQKTAQLADSNNKLIFNAGNICNHFFTREFLHNISNKYANDLTLHVAKKKIPYIDSSGKLCRPETPNGIKIEMFVFDMFQYADKFVTWEVKREEEFSALKNADNSTNGDTPTTARNSIYSLHHRYIKDAGGSFSCNKGSQIVCEISPLISYAGEGLELLVRNKTFELPFLLQSFTEEKQLKSNHSKCECKAKTSKLTQ